VIIQTVLWEYVRMKPDNSYFIDPWTFRGYESVHGTVFAVIGIALLGAIFLVSAKASQAPRNSLAVVGGIAVASWLIAIVFASGEDFTLTGDSITAFLLAVLIGIILVLLASRLAERGGERAGMVKALQGATGVVITIVAIFLLTLLLGAIIGESVTIAAHLGILILMILLGLLMSLMKTPSMAANRMLMVATIVAGTAIGFSGAAVRSTLVRFQSETEPFIPGQYRDTQVTWGYFLANIGVVLVFIGAVMLWARRRDIVQSQARAAKQMAAAEESARELAAAN